MKEIAAIIVTYNPEIDRLYGLINQLMPQIAKVIVVDNGSKNLSEINKIKKHEKISIISLGENLGIAKAQNVGINEVLKNEINYFILFDQDSNIASEYVEKIYLNYFLLSKSNNVGVVGPALYNDLYDYMYPILNVEKNGLVSKKNITTLEKKPFESNMVIASGSFISVDLIKSIGYMKEYFFIDSVDTEFVLRAESYGFKNFIVTDVHLNHLIGDKNIIFFGKKITVHSPFRRYFMFRNFLYMLRLSYVPKLFIIYMLLRLMISQLLIILKSNNKKEYTKSFLNGIKDGVFMRVKDI